ncbi:MAG: ABC transporter permease [Verrucomicrobiae bacterium]|nr:ABC transporter permease [Verrucomicrobiae bacterium]
MTSTLIRKELHQHWWAFLLIGLLSLLGIGWILLFSIMQGQGGSHLIAMRLHAFLLAFSALILGNRLVVAEYSSRTQLFLESLPLPRLRIVLVKFFLGLIVILLSAAGGLSIALVVSARTEVYTPRFIGILNARYLCFAVFVYCFFFGMGFLGRYRFVGYALIIGGITLLTRIRDLQMSDLAPIHLVGGTFPFEREVYPVTSLAITGGLALAFFLLAVALASVREGSVSSLLGERMSYRDKITLTALIFGILSAAYVIDEHKTKAPYQLAGGAEAADTRIARVTVAPTSREARELADQIGKDLDAMADFLGLESMPPIFVIERPDLDPDQFEYGWLDSAEGVIVRTAFRHPDWRYALCLEHLVGDVIENTSHGRAMKEDRFWVIDGFTLYWPHRGDSDAPLDRDRHLLLRALYGTEHLGELRKPGDLHRWFTHQERVGHEITAGIGWSLLRVLEQEAGADAARNWMRTVLATERSPSLISAYRDWETPIDTRFQKITGMSLPEFLGRWNEALDPWRETLAEPLEKLPTIQGKLEFEGEEGATTQVHYDFSPPGETDPEYFTRPVLLYGETAPFEVQLPESQLKRHPLASEESREGWLPETWGSGTGFTWTFAADSPALRCRIISGWRHTHIP